MTNASQQQIKKIGIAGLGAIGSTVARAIIHGIPGYMLSAVSDIKPNPALEVKLVDFDQLTDQADLVIECLPPAAVPELAQMTFKRGKDLILISSCALLMFPEILEWQKDSRSRIYVPSGALAGLDGIKALAQMGIRSSRIASTKPPRGLAGAPYISANKIDLSGITEKTRIFAGNALEAASAFPANVNVAATLSLAGIGPERTQVEVWADPDATGNSHEIRVEGEFSCITAHIDNAPDPRNPKSSMLAAQSIVSTLKNLNESLVVL